jgi:cyclomaltodextrinase
VNDRIPGWARETVWYHVYALGFCGAGRQNPAPGAEGGPVEHRLSRIEAWLDHIEGLGATGLVLGPVFESESHGYDTVDYFRVDRRLGDEDDLVRLFAACHDRGIRVVLDGVFNHVGRRFDRFADVVAQGADSRWAQWFRCRFDGEVPRCDTFEGHEQLVVLNHDNAEVVDFLIGVADHWLERGADGFRLDAAYAARTTFWRAFADRVLDSHPDAYLFAEMIHGDYARFVDRTGVHAVTQYELWKAVWSSLNDGNFFELAHALRRHEEFARSFVPYTFAGNHDVTRIATQLTDPRHLSLASCPADELHRALIALRRSEPWLVTASVEPIHIANHALGYVLTDGSRRVAVALNVDDAEGAVPLTGAGAVLAGDGRSDGGAVILPPHGWAVLRASADDLP